MLLCISLTTDLDFSHQAYLQQPGETSHDCLIDLSLDNNVDDRTFTPEDERAFLIDFYLRTGGPTLWKRRTGWGSNDTHHCQWFGIQCYPNNTYVKSIDLRYNGLAGIP